MRNTHDGVPMVQEKEIGGAIYHVTSHFSSSGSLEELLKKITAEALYDCTIDFPDNVVR